MVADWFFWKNNTGYLMVSLHLGGKVYAKTLHSIVARVWIGRRPKGLYINHIDGDKLNPYYKNLEYISPSENMHHAYSIGLLPKGENHYMSVITEKDAIKAANLIGKGKTNRYIADKLGVRLQLIADLRAGRSWKKTLEAKGFVYPLRKLRKDNSTLTERQVLQIACLMRKGKTNSELVTLLGIKHQTAADIRAGRSWKTFLESKGYSLWRKQ